jgi:hypothetical protein
MYMAVAEVAQFSDQAGEQGSIPGRGRTFFSSPPRRPDRLLGPPSLLSSGYRG